MCVLVMGSPGHSGGGVSVTVRAESGKYTEERIVCDVLTDTTRRREVRGAIVTRVTQVGGWVVDLGHAGPALLAPRRLLSLLCLWCRGIEVLEAG